MYKRIKRTKLGRKKSHRESLINNLLRSLFDNNTVITTTPKAKVLKREASSLIAKGISKGDEVAFRRKLQIVFGKDELVAKFQEYIKKENTGVSFVRVGFRDGDNAEVSRVSLLGLEKKKVKQEKKVEEKKEKDEVKEKEDSKKRTPNVVRGEKKRVDKTAVVKKTTRAKSRSGI